MKRRPARRATSRQLRARDAEVAHRFFEDLMGSSRERSGEAVGWGFGESMSEEAIEADRFFAELLGESMSEEAIEADRFLAELLSESAEATESVETAEATRRVQTRALVRWVQQTLGRANVGPVRVDGIVGVQTRAALRRFQQQHRLRRDSRLLSDTLHALVGVAGTLPAGVWPGPPPTHRGRSPDLSVACPDPPTILDRFAFGSARPTAQHRAALATLARSIAASWDTDAAVHWVCLEGHTDSVGAHAPNEGLGQRRAEAIEAELLVAIERARPGLSSRVGAWSTTSGETEPLVPNTIAANHARNRRVELRLNRRWRGSGGDASVTVTLARAPEGGREDVEDDPSFEVPVGRTIGLVGTGRPVPIGTPAYSWVVADPAIATATQSQGTQQHPNQVNIRGVAAGRTTATVTYRAQDGRVSTSSIVVVVTAPAPVPAVVTRYGCHDLRRGDLDRDPADANRPRWGGQAGAAATVCQPAPAVPPVDPTHVRQLQDDLRTLGFLVVGNPSGSFDRHTEWAVREFQIYAKMEMVARVRPAAAANLHRGAHLVAADNGHDAARNLSEYVASLDSVANAARYGGHVSGVVNAATRTAIDHWLSNEWRCPVVVEAWTMNGGARQRPAAVNLWRHDSHASTVPRMFARDFTGRYAMPPGRNADDMHVIGDFAEFTAWSGSADQRTFSGPRSVPPRHTWSEAELLPAALTGNAAPAGATLSTYRVVRASAEQENIGFFDSVNAYDNAFVSVGPCHWTLGIVNRNRTVSEGELCGYLAYLRHIDNAAFTDAFEFFGARIDESWVSAAGPADGADMFSAGQRKYHGWLALQQDDGTFARLPLLEADGDYFKTWHWHYRLVMAGRTNGGYRRRMWDGARIRIRDIRNVPWGTGVAQVGAGPAARPATIGDVFTSERAMAMILRWHIRAPSHVSSRGNAGARLRAALPAAQAAGPALDWTTDPSTWTDDHERHLVEALRVEARRVTPASIQAVYDWPSWLGAANPRGFTVAAPVAAPLGIGRSSFDFDAAGLPPAPP